MISHPAFDCIRWELDESPLDAVAVYEDEEEGFVVCAPVESHLEEVAFTEPVELKIPLWIDDMWRIGYGVRQMQSGAKVRDVLQTIFRFYKAEGTFRLRGRKNFQTIYYDAEKRIAQLHVL